MRKRLRLTPGVQIVNMQRFEDGVSLGIVHTKTTPKGAAWPFELCHVLKDDVVNESGVYSADVDKVIGRVTADGVSYCYVAPMPKLKNFFRAGALSIGQQGIGGD